MKSRKYLMVVSLFFMFIAFFRGNVPAYNMAEYYPLNQGDEWTWLMKMAMMNIRMPTMLMTRFINGTELVDGVETMKLKAKMNLFPMNGYDCLAVDSGDIKWYRTYNPDGTLRIYDPPIIMYPAQLDLGEIHQSSWSYTDYDRKNNILETGTGSSTSSIEAVEDVTVPAGNFKDCLKISQSMIEQSSDGGIRRIDSTAWLARNFWQVKVDSTWYWSDPIKEDFELAGDMELIRATVDGVNYGCLTTSALGGDSRGNDLNRLRKFRDEVLSKTPQGKEIIRLYYEWSPAIVKAMEEDEEFKKEVKEMVDGILLLIEGELK